jgi:hypothetical protein
MKSNKIADIPTSLITHESFPKKLYRAIWSVRCTVVVGAIVLVVVIGISIWLINFLYAQSAVKSVSTRLRDILLQQSNSFVKNFITNGPKALNRTKTLFDQFKDLDLFNTGFRERRNILYSIALEESASAV